MNLDLSIGCIAVRGGGELKPSALQWKFLEKDADRESAPNYPQGYARHFMWRIGHTPLAPLTLGLSQAIFSA